MKYIQEITYKEAEAFAKYQDSCYESGESPCIDIHHHSWVCSDDDENYCYCEKCGCSEY